MAEWTGYCRQTVSDAIVTAEAAGWLEVTRAEGCSNHYTATIPSEPVYEVDGLVYEVDGSTPEGTLTRPS